MSPGDLTPGEAAGEQLKREGDESRGAAPGPARVDPQEYAGGNGAEAEASLEDQAAEELRPDRPFGELIPVDLTVEMIIEELADEIPDRAAREAFVERYSARMTRWLEGCGITEDLNKIPINKLPTGARWGVAALVFVGFTKFAIRREVRKLERAKEGRAK